MTQAVPLLDIADLTVEFSTRRGIVRAVTHVNVSVGKGETVGIVGESGSGKSVTSYAVMRILDRAGRVTHGAMHFSGVDLTAATEDEMRNLRGREISMVFQNPRAALNPIRKVGHQIEDVLRQHAQVHSTALMGKAIELLEQVHIARPRERYHAYPFELSGGMCQRVVIALALACRPRLLIRKLTKEYPRTGGGGKLGSLFARKRAAEPEALRAVDNISFEVNRGESVGLVGESGCGKSTTSSMVMRLIEKNDGVIIFDGEDIGEIPPRKFARLALRKRIQMVFQDPTDSLNPRFTAARAIADPILRLGEKQ